MFIHWGLYCVPAGAWDGKPVPGLGEWIMNDAQILVAPYAAQAARFDPKKFDAAAWVHIAQAAGMKYIVITAKHHEGFAMYPTSVDGYSLAAATPFKRDPIRELDDACQKAGIKFGVYYSQGAGLAPPRRRRVQEALGPVGAGRVVRHVPPDCRRAAG